MCNHHWHTVKDTHRKVRSSYSPVCENWSHEDKKYINPGMLGLYEIVVKYVRHCCTCDKKEIMTWYVEATMPDEKRKALSYPDIEESPLKLSA